MESNFDYEVSLSPDNDDKWHEMLRDSESRKIMLDLYNLLVSNDRQSVNDIIEKAYLSHKEGNLAKHYESFKRLYEATDHLKDYKL